MARQKMIVVFDTSALFQGTSPVYFVNFDASQLIRASHLFVDLEIEWYVPEPVRKEREYQ